MGGAGALLRGAARSVQVAALVRSVGGGAARAALDTAQQGDDSHDQPASSDGATEWLNSPPLTPAGLRGRVVLVQFWTFTCINWLRTLPDIRAWAEKYENDGLLALGVHTPEFWFEHDLDNVRRAVKDMQIGDLHLVLRPGDMPVGFRVSLDGEAPGAAHGTDVDEQGNGVVSEPRLYQLMRQPGRIEEHTFEITFLEPGVEAYVFTFC